MRNAIGRGSVQRIRGQRNSGFTVIEVLAVVFLITILLALLLPAVQEARETARIAHCRNNLRNIGVACHNMQAATGQFPALGKVYVEGGFGFSCFVQLVPYCEQAAFFDAMDFEGDSMSASNLSLVNANPIPFLHCPSDPVQYAQLTNYLGNGGTRYDRSLRPVYDGFLDIDGGTRPAEFSDGLSNTVAFTECVGYDGTEVVDRKIMNIRPRAETYDDWRIFRARCANLDRWQDDQVISPSRSAGIIWTSPGLGCSRYNHILPPGSNSCQSGGKRNLGIISPNSRHNGIAVTLYADGSVTQTDFGIDGDVWRKQGTRDGGL